MGDYRVPCVNTQLCLRVFGGLNNVNNVASQPHLHLSNQLYPEEEHGQAETSLYTALGEPPLKSGSMQRYSKKYFLYHLQL